MLPGQKYWNTIEVVVVQVRHKSINGNYCNMTWNTMIPSDNDSQLLQQIYYCIHRGGANGQASQAMA